MLRPPKRNCLFDHGTRFLAVLGMGIPNFFLAILLIQLFAVKLHWLPVAGSDRLKHIVLPAVVLSAEAIAINLRSCVVRARRARPRLRPHPHAKGLQGAAIIWVHVPAGTRCRRSSRSPA